MTHLSGRPLAQARMALGMVFQQPYLVRRRSVMANVLSGTLGRNQTLWTSLGGLPRRELPFATQCLDHVGLAALARQRAGTLSAGRRSGSRSPARWRSRPRRCWPTSPWPASIRMPRRS